MRSAQYPVVGVGPNGAFVAWSQRDTPAPEHMHAMHGAAGTMVEAEPAHMALNRVGATQVVMRSVVW